MAALGATGPGLFSQEPESSAAAAAASRLPTAAGSRLQQLLQRQQTYNRMKQNSQLPDICRKVPKSFREAVQNFPSEFYFPNFELPAPLLPGVRLPDYCSSASPSLDTAAPLQPRKVEFRPPHGPPINYPSVIGCGSGAGLAPGQLAVWDQENEFYYFLDCNRKTVTANEQRKKRSSGFRPAMRKTQLTIQRGQSEKNLELPPCNPAIIRAAAERAAKKPHGCILRASGKNGRNGMSAIPSADGSSGSEGGQGEAWSNGLADGTDGGDGSPGRDGRHAEPGEDGGIGKSVIVELYGDVKELGIDGTCQSVARLGGEECEEVLYVNCGGGDGGEGGRGGNGGKGGDGGNGGRGQGGGHGGHGGAGGLGGRGGNGGSGGSGGRGGNCIVRASDPRLLMLVEVNCDTGRPGQGGRGGLGGSGGKMGLGGAGSSSSEVLFSDKDELQPCDGLQGKPGSGGISGEAGQDAECGFTNKAGSLQWVITEEDGKYIASAPTRFDAEVLSMKVTSASSLGDVFEPHQRIQVSDVVVVNSGGLTLPPGAIVSIPSTDTVRFEPTTYTLPKLEPSEQIVVPVVFRGRIVDEPSPNTSGPLEHTCQFAPRVELLGRPFDKSPKWSLPVRYPVRLAYALGKKNVHQGEVTTLEVGVENLSSIPYGATGGSVLVHILLDPRLRPLGLAPSRDRDSADRSDFEVSYNPSRSNSVFVLVKNILPGKTLTVPIVVRLEEAVELGDRCRWQAEVYLRGKLIEYSFSVMRVAPSYSSARDSLSSSSSSTSSLQQQLADVLLIKSDALGEREERFWQRIFELLEVSYDYWDGSVRATRASSLQQLLPPFRQEYRGKLIVHPHCDLTKLTAEDIVGHFKSGDDASCDSSMLLFTDSPAPDSLEQYIQCGEGTKRLLSHVCANEQRVEVAPEMYSGKHLVSPGTILPFDWTLQKAQRRVLKKLEREVPAHVPVITGQSNALRRQGLTYSYGKLNIRRCPLPRTANFQCVDGATGQVLGMGCDDPHLSTASRDVPLASNFGQVFLATLSGLPFHLKLNLLRQPLSTSSPLFIKFHLPNGATLTRNELAAISLARDIVDETLDGSTDLRRMHSLAKHIKEASNSSTLTSADEALLTQLLGLVKREVQWRQGRSSGQVSAKQLLGLSTLASRHLSSSSSSSPRPSLPLLSQLQSRIVVLRPHQLTTHELLDLSYSQ